MTKFMSDSDKEFIWSNSSSTINTMTELKVLPTPQNYQLWYTHTAQADLSLSKVVDSMIAKKMNFNEDLNAKLYEKFFSSEKEMKTVVETGATFQKELAKIAAVLKQTGKDTGDHTKTLSDQLGKLSGFEGSDELKDIVNLVISNTDKIREQTEVLETKLEESSSKINELQTNLENARLESRTDALTNINNRKAFDEELIKNIEAYNHTGEEFCLLLCDIDFFKKFNDNYGHQIGDQVLKVVAHVIKKETGTLGFPARYGGEEFAVIVPKSKLEGAAQLADNIRRIISQRTIKNKNTGAHFGRITMSFGVAEIKKHEPMDDLVQRADSALYLSKANGRNKVSTELELDQVIPAQATA